MFIFKVSRKIWIILKKFTEERNLNFQVHVRAIWLSEVRIYRMSGDNIDPVTLLNKWNPINILCPNIHIKKILIPAPVIFWQTWKLALDLKMEAVVQKRD